jgi:hypothetical protein
LHDPDRGITKQYVRDTIFTARDRYGLLTSFGKGRPGGKLTPKALDLIAQSQAGGSDD